MNLPSGYCQVKNALIFPINYCILPFISIDDPQLKLYSSNNKVILENNCLAIHFRLNRIRVIVSFYGILKWWREHTPLLAAGCASTTLIEINQAQLCKSSTTSYTF
ncbi:MAG: hypothetical protein NHB15_12505 [Methanosarcina barkeri]|nr:hypothetical protein [Methanosarcina sp. ERenArc_MAG2]